MIVNTVSILYTILLQNSIMTASCCEGFTEGTKVMTQDGYKNIEDVVLNDKLLTGGKKKDILSLQRNIYNGDMYNVYIKNHPSVITSTAEQAFYVREKKYITINGKIESIFNSPKWKKIKILTTNDYYGMMINTSRTIPEFTFDTSSNFEKIPIKLDKKEYWYMMGYFVCDGWLDERDRRCMYKIRISMSNNEDESKVLECMNEVLPLTIIPTINKRCKTLGCSSFMWYSILKMYGNDITEKQIPEWVQDAPKEFIQEFINGYMKAYGGIDENSTTIVSYNLALGLQRLYFKLGKIFSVCKSRLSAINGRAVHSYCLLGNGNDSSSFIEDDYVWYEPFHISKIKAIDTPVYNFEIKNCNSYVVENKRVHNSYEFI